MLYIIAAVLVILWILGSRYFHHHERPRSHSSGDRHRGHRA